MAHLWRRIFKKETPQDNLPVRMIRPNLDNIPEYDLPPSYTIRHYQPGDELAWERIHVEADQYNPVTPELFQQQFGQDVKLLAERQFYLCDAAGQAIGTASAWLDIYQGQPYGRVHWVALVPSRQGQGLAKPLLSVVCRRLRELQHDRAYLSTSTARIPAIGLYLKFGFRPHVRSEQEFQAWRRVWEKLGSNNIPA